ncbi:hypothetical protein [Microbacterium ulmi]|uniref:Uncharacterized protein n=1 Tax=Microbacterium ulmi TaxID=179095 RepID=A0A7Y2Q1U8_9MICO|nr:hypothetical protein [Microbacterium ulmi]NII69084.1 hypothetical protein [Microbacterium ulmi]NNH04722.1 hypothetical protein [Microbacterium ulmi]
MATPRSGTATAPRSEARRSTTAQAVATGLAGAVAFAAGTTIAYASTYGLSGSVLLAAVSSAALLVWLAGVSVLGVLVRRGRDVVFAAATVLFAPAATVVESLLRTGGADLLAYPYLLVVLAWQSLGLVGAALVGAIVGVLVRRHREASGAAPSARAREADTGSGNEAVPGPGDEAAAGSGDEAAPGPGDEAVPGPGDEAAADFALRATREPRDVPASPGAAGPERRRATILSGVCIALLVIGGALAFVLPTQWLGVYFRIWGEAAVATPAQGTRYLWTAGLSLAVLLAALVVAIVRRGRGLIVLTSLALGCALIGAFVFEVPQGRFWPDPDPVTYDDDFPVCYGTTGDCPGG